MPSIKFKYTTISRNVVGLSKEKFGFIVGDGYISENYKTQKASRWTPFVLNL